MPDKVVFAVKRSSEVADHFKLLRIVASMNQQMVFSATINLPIKKYQQERSLPGHYRQVFYRSLFLMQTGCLLQKGSCL
jgi:hypothetical protein